MDAKYCDQWVCMSVCLSSHISHSQKHLNFIKYLYMLDVTVALSSFNDSAIWCVLLVCWMTSYFHIIEPMGQN